jgi:hypothetical protein
MKITQAFPTSMCAEKNGLAAQTLCRWLGLTLAASLGLMAAGCSTTTTLATTTAPANPSQLYFAPTVGDQYASTYAIDHTANTFVRDVYGFDGSTAAGATVTDSGAISTLSNGVVSLAISYNESTSGVQTIDNPPLTGNWAVELPGEAALIGMKAYSNFTPAVPTESCPNLATPETFLFVTIPNRLSSDSTPVTSNKWNPLLETAFGTAQIATTGTSVQFTNISQYTLPVKGAAPGAPSNPGQASVTTACSQTFYGYTIGVPNAVTVINPGTGQSIPPSATIGIGPAGFLVEDAGASQIAGQPYENVLGAGYGAIGLPMPSSSLSTPALVAAQYQGFLYGSGGPVSLTQTGPGFSLIGSFGYSNLQAACPTLPAPATATILYGGEFANNDPSSNASGNCDLAFDLGTQDAKTNGLYPAAKVYVTAGFPMNGISSAYSFPAVAIAGQIGKKYAIFLIGVDTAGSPSQAWGIYLLQSN